ncbi:MAG TPA: thioredoxin family protein [Acidobacteriaceae bacterium]|nr:thioredoxin family protein [Acidobacteriaceae bacterium]
MNARSKQRTQLQPDRLKRLGRALILLAGFLFAPAFAWRSLHAQIAVVGDGGPGPEKAQHLTAEMVSLGPSIAPGGKQIVGLVLTIEDGWHVYWVNAGDSGDPPQIDWTLPDGFTAGPMQFPIPQRLPLGPMMDFGYEDHVAFPVMIAAPASAAAGPVHLDAQISWLVCQDVCLPGKAHLGIDLNVQPNAPDPSREAKLGALGEALTLLPKPLPSGDSVSARADANRIAVTLTGSGREPQLEFYPFDHDTDPIVNAAAQTVDSNRKGATLYLQRSPLVQTLPPALHGLLKLSDDEAYDVTIPVLAGAVTPPPAHIAGSMTAVAAIGLAFLGGIILNLMPCVFPVLFLKALGLVQTTANADEKSRRHLLAQGLVYALGIVVSFWAIVGALLVVRAGGHHAGWGFQLQSPAFLAVLASFLFLFGLSLAGQFDFGLSLTSVGDSLARKQGYAGSFFTGVLATVVATPCTGPFMGAAVGFAVAQPAIIAFAVFTSLALGLALPYVLLSWQPAWARLLPKPGAWMEVLKQLTAIPLFATVIWFTWVYGQTFSASDAVSQVAFLLVGFLVLSIAGWTLGRWPAKPSGRVAAAVLILLALAVPLEELRHRQPRTAEMAGAAVGSAQPNSGPLVWQPYSEDAIVKSRTAGHPVFIDFTASWCLSCQVNERLVLKSPQVQDQFRARNFMLLRADWTNADEVITNKLASLGRAGVPTYVIYPAAQTAAADVLPELLTKDIVLNAIRKDAR